MDFIVVGVDPGITGAIAWLGVDNFQKTVTLLDVVDVPTAVQKTNGKAKSHVLLSSLAALFAEAPWRALGVPTHAYIEEVNAMPRQGVTSMFRFGYVAGALAGITAALEIPMTLIRPREWQATARVRPEPDAGRLRAAQLFPSAAALFRRKLDHNRADAVLIAYAGAVVLSGAPLVAVGSAAKIA
jgi:crossover junction endodeoxyribonuclease RuvC